jgi:hypothetical protein
MCYIRDRSGKSAQALWEFLPAVVRGCGVCYLDFWSSYPVAVSSKRHRAVAKETAKTSYPLAIQLYFPSTGIPTRSENVVLLAEARKLHWRN